jgi:hypothetical protein
MSKQIARLLKTDVMADIDIPAIAQFLQSQGRRGDTILAHINAKEAEMLKKMGGAEERNPVTGLPEYFTIEGDYAYGTDPYANTSTSNYDPPTSNYDLAIAGNNRRLAEQDMNFNQSDFAPTTYYSPETPYEIDPPRVGSGYQIDPSKFIGQSFPIQAGQQTANEIGRATTLRPEDIALGKDRVLRRENREIAAKIAREAGIEDGVRPGMMDRASATTGLSKEALARLGLAGLGTIQGIMSSREASEQGRQARRETEALARPYQQRGQQLTEQAQSGELTAAGQQQLQALRARLAQGAEARGGVGAAQAAAQVEAFRQNLLQNQYDYGQKVSNIGDQLMLGAIRTGLEADRYAASLSNTYFTNMASIAAGLPPSMPVQQRGE